MSLLLEKHCGRLASAAQIRHAVADFIRDTPNSHPRLAELARELSVIGEESSPHVRTLAAYAEHIRADGTYASARYEVPIVAELYNLRILVTYQRQAMPSTESAMGEDMRDHDVEPPAGSWPEAPKQVHLLLLTPVSALTHTHTHTH